MGLGGKGLKSLGSEVRKGAKGVLRVAENGGRNTPASLSPAFLAVGATW